MVKAGRRLKAMGSVMDRLRGVQKEMGGFFPRTGRNDSLAFWLPPFYEGAVAQGIWLSRQIPWYESFRAKQIVPFPT
jgi:hypothetical protein